MRDCERWVGKGVKILSNPHYDDIDDLFLDTRFMVTPYGAKCMWEMKRRVRERYQRPNDFHVFGLTADEGRRIAAFEQRNSDLKLMWVLLEAGITKEDCYRIIGIADIELPVMYKMGYGHNNCIGCVKGGKGYWNKIRRDFPDVFARRAAVQREVGCSFGGTNGAFFLDELDPEAGRDEPPQDIECGPMCRAEYTDADIVGGAVKTATTRFLPLTLVDVPPPPERLR